MQVTNAHNIIRVIIIKLIISRTLVLDGSDGVEGKLEDTLIVIVSVGNGVILINK